jgi:hypothetical protein
MSNSRRSDSGLDHSSSRTMQCARLPNLIFDTPAVTPQRRILIFGSGP